MSLGASPSERDELLAYNKNLFDHSAVSAPIKLPFPDEPFVSAWEEYEREACDRGVFKCLKSRLVQLNFPIQKGVSRTQSYGAATRRGLPVGEMPEATGLEMKRPDALQLTLYHSPAGRIPLLITAEREDFVSLVRALAMKNEPGPVPDSMGACTVTGYNNWDRVRRLRQQWESRNPEDTLGTGWAEEFRRITLQKELYQDRFMILSYGPYSGVSAEKMGLSGGEWAHTSLIIRREHECAHYFTKRLFSSMKNRLMDELLADCMGIIAAAGRYRADWFLRFVGLEDFPEYRKGGRLENYRGDPPLSYGAFRIIQVLVRRAAENLEAFDSQHQEHLQTSGGRAAFLTALTFMTLEELASNGASDLFIKALKKGGSLLSGKGFAGHE